MPNMSYCRFQNTFYDLRDCYEALCYLNNDLSETEEHYKKRMLDLCKKMTEEFNYEHD